MQHVIISHSKHRAACQLNVRNDHLSDSPGLDICLTKKYIHSKDLEMVNNYKP